MREAISIPLVANGDCAGPHDARAMLAAAGADAVMVGRAAVGRPWLVGRIATELAGVAAQEPDDAAKAEAALDHYTTLLSIFGVGQGVRHARKHLAAYADRAAETGGGLPAALRARLVTSDDPDEAAGLLARCFARASEKAA